jgi:hypothetical protein
VNARIFRMRARNFVNDRQGYRTVKMATARADDVCIFPESRLRLEVRFWLRAQMSAR